MFGTRAFALTALVSLVACASAPTVKPAAPATADPEVIAPEFHDAAIGIDALRDPLPSEN